jgi:soluble lytic murein transglycosylase-like protein
VLVVAAVCLVPASSLAEDITPAKVPLVIATCEITGVLAEDAPKTEIADGTPGPALEKGTPSGVMEDDRICVRPPEPAAAPETPEQPAAEPPAPEPAAPVAEAPAAAAEPAPSVEPAPSAEPVPPVEPQASAPAGQPSATPAEKAPEHKTQRTSAQPRAHSRPRAETNFRGHRTPKRAAVKPVLPETVPGPLEPAFYVNDEAVIPRFLIKLYKQAGRHHHIPWPILAAINEIETDFGRNTAVSSAGAVGWMQFMPATWKVYGVDADHDGTRDPRNPRDAIFSAARYLRASGAKSNMRKAIFASNHAGWYVDSVLLRAERIASQHGERSRRLSRLLKSGKRHLERQVLTDPRITLYDCGRKDIEEHRIDRRVLITLRFLAWSGLNPTVTSLECGHGYYTKSGNVSEHSSGNAVDISAINGVPILGNQGAGSVTEATIRELLTLRGAGRPHQIISLMTFENVENAFAMTDHADHIHIGFAPLKPIEPADLTEISEPAPPALVPALIPLSPITFPWTLSG